ncbi:MAG: hypothetical protein Aurels2KO_11440 [Aureliella sp.]
MASGVNPCCYCGLLCSSAPEISHCSRRKRVLDQNDGQGDSAPDNATETLLGFADTARPLIWVDAADVATMREVIRFAEAAGATVHVGQTTGTKIQKRVSASEGWLGASLNEAANHADLVISIGDSLHSEIPNIDRLLSGNRESQRHWCHIGSQPSEPADSNINLHRHEWYNSLTSLLLAIREPKLHVAASPAVNQLRERIETSRYGVIVWHADEFLDELDELILRRLTELARQVTQNSRLSLVCIDSSPGRITAQETMLWATGQVPSATFHNGTWVQRKELDAYTLQDFHESFTSTLMIRSVCTATPLPNLACDVALLPRRELHVAPQACRSLVAVASVGEQIDGLLFRGDHAAVIKCRAPQDTGSDLPITKMLLNEATEQLLKQQVGAS